MPRILSSVACNLDNNILAACYPLFSESKVEAIEWSFDALFRVKDVPDWFYELLSFYSKEYRLVGHGVFFSLFSGRWLPEQQEWLDNLEKVSRQFRFDHVTEHFGFMTGKNFHQGAPLNIPFTSSTLAIGRDRLARIQQACDCPVGLENLAFAYTLDEVKQHGSFLEELITPVNGFIILDLHNLYCQLHNFNVGFSELIKLYPLHRVREIHISGGSWQETEVEPGRKVRRDTHDDGVPQEVFNILRQTIPLCPHLKYVVMEQLGTGLNTEESRKQYYNDFLEMQRIVALCNDDTKENIHPFLPPQDLALGTPIEDEQLYSQQRELADILETSNGYNNLYERLQQSSLAATEWQLEAWQPAMLETAMLIAQKWK